jgi:uncharacterized protein (DUF362 family)
MTTANIAFLILFILILFAYQQAYSQNRDKNMKRRQFLKVSAATGAAGMLPYSKLRAGTENASNYFSVHPFIDANPDAVFIMRTDASSKYDTAGKKQAGEAFGASVFSLTDDASNGFPLSHNIVLKPNLTSRGEWQTGYTVERTMGVVTDSLFVEGMIESMKSQLGLPGSQFYIREVNGSENIADGGYGDLAQRTGADVKTISTQVNNLSPDKVVWKQAPDGVWFDQIPYLWPVNSPDSVLLNIAKLKSHGMGMTLTAKNLQGTIAAKYQQHCTAHNRDMSIDYNHVRPNAKSYILDNYNRHLADGIPRWDRPGQTGGLWQETWGTRCIDNNSTTKPALHIIEGIYGHDGNFVQGPHDGLAADFMTNVLIFGKNPYHVDIIGTWLAGHEPGNFGLFHMALERGLSTLLNPKDIPVFEWFNDGSATETLLDTFERTPLKTYYLQRDYDGQNEDYWHLVDEAYEYSATNVAAKNPVTPSNFEVQQNYPNPFNGGTSIEYILPKAGHVQVEIYNAGGQRVEILKRGLQSQGRHNISWRPQNMPTGVYMYRCVFDGQVKSGRMLYAK